MSEKLICPNCGEEVEDNFEICWNCQTAINNKSKNIKEDQTNPEPNKISDKEFVKVDGIKIIYAGKALIRIFYTMLITIVIGIVGAITLLIIDKNALIKNVTSWIIAVGLISNFIILFNIYYAGKDLKESVKSAE